MADLVGTILVLAALVLVGMLLVSRRDQSAPEDVDSPLKRLTGFHIFGPEEDDGPPLHVPVIRLRVAEPAPAPPAAEPAPAAAPAPPASEPAAVAEPVPDQAERALQRIAAFADRLPFAVATPSLSPSPEPPPPPVAPPAPAPAAVTDAVPARVVAAVVEPRPPRPAAPQRERRRGELPLDGDILLVEDDIGIADMYRLLLHSRGYATRHAHDGVEGIAMVREERPALILLDMMMPRMDGLQFLEALRTWPKTSAVPVVVLSNADNLHLVDRAMELGAVEYLVKAQTRPQVLAGALPHWLRGNRALSAMA